MKVIPGGRVAFSSFPQPSNARFPSTSTLSGIVISVSELQFPNAPSPIMFRDSGMLTLLMFSQE